MDDPPITLNSNQDPPPTSKWHTVVVRIWREAGDVRLGQVSDPQTGWRAALHSAVEWWQLLATLPDPALPDDPAPDPEDEQD